MFSFLSKTSVLAIVRGGCKELHLFQFNFAGLLFQYWPHHWHVFLLENCQRSNISSRVFNHLTDWEMFIFSLSFRTWVYFCLILLLNETPVGLLLCYCTIQTVDWWQEGIFLLISAFLLYGFKLCKFENTLVLLRNRREGWPMRSEMFLWTEFNMVSPFFNSLK